MKTIFFIALCVCVATVTIAQTDAHYTAAMAAYKNKDYTTAATRFDEIINAKQYNITTGMLYDGACIYALQGNMQRAIDILTFLADKRYWSNLDHLRADTDLESLHATAAWPAILQQVEQNHVTQPARTRAKIKSEAAKAKTILDADGGKLWGENFWSDNILFLEPDNTFYALKPIPGTIPTDNGLYTAKAANPVLSQTNTVQIYQGVQYATAITGYLNDSSATIIHELFHVMHYKHKKLLGDPVNYLDNADAREWLRLEFQALRQALQAAALNGRHNAEQYVYDALVFRKLRQTQYAASLDGELQIETLEGLANYTGLVLANYPDRYARVIKEIASREVAPTYTRPFPYATGPAYGMLFDYLGLHWRMGLDHVYNFLTIYETQYKTRVSTTARVVKAARARNNYLAIHREETIRQQEHDRQVALYTAMLIDKPVLSVTLAGNQYSRSFDMNGTLVLGTHGMVYSNIKGTDTSGNNFGDFKILPEKGELGVTGILGTFDGRRFTFPLPFRREGNKLIGEWYEIELHNGWEPQPVNEKGDMEIVRKR